MTGKERTSPSDRLGWVDAGRGLAILLVVAYHAARWLSKAGFDTAGWQLVNETLSTLRMPLFFTLSGLFARKWLTASWRDLLRTKVALFAWVSVVWGAIGTVTFVLGTAADGQRVSILDAGIAYLLSPLVPRLELWFIWALALFFVIAKLTRRAPVTLQLGVFAAVSAISLTVWLNQTTGATGSLKYYVFFLGGLYLRQLVFRWSNQSNLVQLVAIGIWAAVSVLLTVSDSRSLPGVYFVNCVLGVLAGIAASRYLSRLPLLSNVGKQTLPIYLAHTPIISLAVLPLSMTGLPALSSPDLISTPILAGAAVVVSILLWKVSLRGLLRYLYEPPLDLYDRVVKARGQTSSAVSR